MNIIARLRNEPAVVIGTLFAVILAVFQTLAGRGVIGPDLVDTLTRALDPNAGWALPIVLSIIIRFFVSPAR